MFVQNHRLAVSLLVEALHRGFKHEDLNLKIEEEVNSVYGRLDVVVRITTTGILIEVANKFEVIIEVKTGKGFTYAQVFRYLMEKPSAILVLWKVTQRQIIVFEGSKLRRIILMIMEAALDRGNDILNDSYEECGHDPVRNKPYVLENAQGLADDFLSALSETISSVVGVVLGIIRNRLKVVEVPYQ